MANSEKDIHYIEEHKIVVIAPRVLKKAIIPLFCPLCEMPMKTKEDGFSFVELGCCETCDNNWRSSIRNLGLTFSDIKISTEFENYRKNRQNKSRTIINLK